MHSESVIQLFIIQLPLHVRLYLKILFKRFFLNEITHKWCDQNRLGYYWHGLYGIKQ